MFTRIIKSLLNSIVVLVLVVIFITSIIYSSPVDPTRLTFGQRMDEETVLLKKKQLGLDQPLTKQILLYLGDLSPLAIIDNDRWNDLPYTGLALFKGRHASFVLKLPYLRESFQNGRSVSNSLFKALPSTLILASLSIIIAAILGIGLGILASMLQGTLWDDLILTISTLGYSVPSYVSAIFFALLFGYYFKEQSGLNIQGSLIELDDFGEERIVLKNIILPCLALSIRPVAVITQLMRSAMNDVSRLPFILALKAKGLSNFRLIFRHIARNALNPVATSLSGWFASLLAGAFFVEYVFSYKGLGYLTINALLNFDIPMVLGAIVLSSTFFILINITIDLVYKYLDPRIQ